MSHLLFEDINSVLYEEYLEEKADVKAMITDFDRDALNNAIHNAIKELDPEAEVGNNLNNVISKVVGVLQEEAPQIQDNFEREDRVVWAIKFLKFHLLCSVGSTTETWYKGKRFTPDQMSAELFKNVFSKMNFMKKLQKTQGRDSVEQEYTAFGTGGRYTPLRIKQMLGNLLRYLETGIKPILDFVWDPKLTYTYLKRELEDIYEDYKKQLKGWAPVDEDAGDKIIIAYKSEKMYWFDLQRPSCSLEGDAAGHCGNSPRSDTNDNVYSLSTLKKVGKDWYRYPHITAVLEDDGLLGEIKGRGNTTPHGKYGDKLVDLCLLPEVDGIGRARWEEGENWMWDHFTEEQQKRILDVKPGFMVGESGDIVYRGWVDGTVSGGEFEEWLRENIELNYTEIQSVDGDDIITKPGYDVSDVYRQAEDGLHENVERCLQEYVDEHGDDEWDITEDDRVDDFKREVFYMFYTNNTWSGAKSNFQKIFGDSVDTTAFYTRLYEGLRGMDDSLDEAVEKIGGDFSKVKNLSIFDTPHFDSLFYDMTKELYEYLEENTHAQRGRIDMEISANMGQSSFAYNDFYILTDKGEIDDIIRHDDINDDNGNPNIKLAIQIALDYDLFDMTDPDDYPDFGQSNSGEYDAVGAFWMFHFGKDAGTFTGNLRRRSIGRMYKQITGKNHPKYPS
jgi:hypothetical protein